MKTANILAAFATLGVLGITFTGCTTVPFEQPASSSSTRSSAKAGGAGAAPTQVHPTANMSMDRYKRTLAQFITHMNPDKVYPGNPQPMLRSVVVVKYVIDANGTLVRSDILRSNDDKATIGTALSALRHAAPFPPPPPNLLNHGHVEMLETMLFNDDGRFQLRSIAAPQLDE